MTPTPKRKAKGGKPDEAKMKQEETKGGKPDEADAVEEDADEADGTEEDEPDDEPAAASQEDKELRKKPAAEASCSSRDSIPNPMDFLPPSDDMFP